MTIQHDGTNHPRYHGYQHQGGHHGEEQQHQQHSALSLDQTVAPSTTVSIEPSAPTLASVSYSPDMLRDTLSLNTEQFEDPLYRKSIRDKNYPEAIRLINEAISEELFVEELLIDQDKGSSGNVALKVLYHSRGIAYLLNNQPRKALEDFVSLSQSDEGFVCIDFLLGLTYLKLGNEDLAIVHFKKAMEFPKTKAEAAFELSKICYKKSIFAPLKDVSAALYESHNNVLSYRFAEFVLKELHHKIVLNERSFQEELNFANNLLTNLLKESDGDPEAKILLAKFEILRFAAGCGEEPNPLDTAAEIAKEITGAISPAKEQGIELSTFVEKYKEAVEGGYNRKGFLWLSETELFTFENSNASPHKLDDYLVDTFSYITLEPSEPLVETTDLVELYTKGDDAMKSMIATAYRSVTQELLKAREGSAYLNRLAWDSTFQAGGKVPPLSLGYRYVGNIFESFQRLIEQESDKDAKSYYYPVIKHVIENLMPDLLIGSEGSPLWLNMLTKKDPQLGKIITDQAKVDDGTKAKKSVNSASSKFCMNLYYLQNAFLKSIGSHIDTFLSPDKKLLEKDEYLTFAYQKFRYRIGVKPFIVKYNELGWPESVDFDRTRTGPTFLENTCHPRGKITANSESCYWLTTHETYLLFEHIQKNGLTYTDKDGESQQFTLIPDKRKVKKEPERKDDAIDELSDDDDTPSLARRKRSAETSKPRETRKKKDETTRTTKQQLIDNIFNQLESSSNDGDFLSSLSVGCVKGLGTLHKKVAEQQAKIDAQCVTKTLTCAHSELLKKDGIDADQVPVYLNVDGFYQLKQYQRESLIRILDLKQKGIPGAILGLEMGLGKTLVMAELLMHLFRDQPAPVLFLCPRNVMAQIVEKLREYLIIAQLGQLEEQLRRAEGVPDEKRFKKVVGAVNVYLGYLIKLGIKSSTVNDKIRKLQDTVRTMHSKRGIPMRWSPQFIDNKSGRVNQETLNKIFNQDMGNDAGCHLLSIHPIQDIYTPRPGEVLDGSLSDKRKVIVYNNDAVNSVVNTNKSKGLDQVLWGALFVDEAQNLHNIQKETYQGAKAIIDGVSSKTGAPPFVLLSTGTPYQNYDSDPFALLSLTEPKGEFQSDSGEVFTVTRMQRLIEERHQNVKTKMAKYLRSSKKQDYEDFQSAYLQYLSLVENFKKILNDVCIIVKREDVRDQWDGRIPEVIISDDNLVLDEKFARQKARLEDLSAQFQNDYNQEMDSANKLRSSIEVPTKRTQKKRKSFLEFVGDVSRTIVHPDFYGGKKASRTEIAKRLADPKQTSQEEVKKWVDESILLSNMLDDDFGREMQDGSIIFVDEIATGEAIQACIRRLYPDAEQVDFLQGSTSVSQRQQMVDKFESKNPRRRQRVMIIMAQSGCAGTDLRTNGKTAHICYFDFNPGNIEQAKSRIIRANSPKDKVEIVYYNIEDLYFCECVKRHRKRKMAMEKYFFQPQTSKDIGLTGLSRDLLEILMLECSVDTGSRTGIALAGRMAKYIAENERALQRAIDSSSAMEKAPVKFTVAASHRSESIQIFPEVRPVKDSQSRRSLKARAEPMHKKQRASSSSSRRRSPLSLDGPTMDELPSFKFKPKEQEEDLLGGLSFRKRKRTVEQEQAASSSSRESSTQAIVLPAEESSKRQRGGGSMEHSFSRDLSIRKRGREEELEKQSVQLEEGEVIDPTPLDSKRQKTRDFNHTPRALYAQPPQQRKPDYVSSMKDFYARAEISNMLISNCSIQVNGFKWGIIPVLSHRACYDAKSTETRADNFIQAIACGMNLLREDPRMVARNVLPALRATENLPLRVRTSPRSIERENPRFYNWLKKIHDQGRTPPSSFAEVKDYLIHNGYTLVVHSVERDGRTGRFNQKRNVIVQGRYSQREIHLLESRANDILQYDVLTRELGE